MKILETHMIDRSYGQEFLESLSLQKRRFCPGKRASDTFEDIYRTRDFVPSTARNATLNE